MGLDGFPRHRHRGRDVEGATVETERVLHVVQRNFMRLTHQGPMVAIEDLLEEMQQHVVGVPQDWVRLFQCVAIAIVYFLVANPE